jgi:plasmid maintenance system antidote protein VapI
MNAKKTEIRAPERHAPKAKGPESQVRELHPERCRIVRALEGASDYRDVLNEALRIRREAEPRLSESAFARELGMRRTQLNDALKGKKGISCTVARKIAPAMGLMGNEIELFCDLVESEHARSGLVRQWARQRLARRNPTLRVQAHEPRPAAPVPVQEVEGSWAATSRSTTDGPVPPGFGPDEWMPRWTFRDGRFEIESGRGQDARTRLRGRYEQRNQTLLLTVDEVEGSGDGSLEPGRRHYVFHVSEDELVMKTPGAALPTALCGVGHELETRLRRH